MQTEVITASAMRDLSLSLLELRQPGTLKAHAKALAKYERDLAAGGHKEVTAKLADGWTTTTKTGYYVIADNGGPQLVERPRKPTPLAYGYRPYIRDGYAPAGNYGLLADSKFNRDIRNDRVLDYFATMKVGQWRDLLSDPISITADGQVLNGQHRIAAATLVDWSEVDNDPSFLVVWGVDPVEAQFADGSRRTNRDEKVIADKLVASLTAA
jgi:hypothetical protein